VTCTNCFTKSFKKAAKISQWPNRRSTTQITPRDPEAESDSSKSGNIDEIDNLEHAHPIAKKKRVCTPLSIINPDLQDSGAK